MIYKICKNLFNLLFLITALMMPFEQQCVHEDCFIQLSYTENLLQSPFAKTHHNPQFPPHDDDEESGPEELNGLKEAEFNERPEKKRRKARKLALKLS